MKIKQLTVVASFVVAAVVLIGAVGSVRAADEWFVLSEQTIKAADQGVDMKITKAVLGWDNRPDDTITDIGVLKAGGSTTPKDAPGRKGRLKSVTVTYKIVGDAPTAVLKVWGFD